MTTEEKLQHFEESSLERAREMAAQQIEDHKTALAKLEAEHKETKLRQAELEIKTESDNLKRANNMAISKEQLQIKREITKKQAELKEKLFVEVKTKLEEYMGTHEYNDLLKAQIEQILKTANGSDYIIYLDPADTEKRMDLQMATGAQIAISEYSFMGGTRAVLKDRHMLIDNSFASKLAEAKEEFKFDGGTTHE